MNRRLFLLSAAAPLPVKATLDKRVNRFPMIVGTSVPTLPKQRVVSLGPFMQECVAYRKLQ